MRTLYPILWVSTSLTLVLAVDRVERPLIIGDKSETEGKVVITIKKIVSMSVSPTWENMMF